MDNAKVLAARTYSQLHYALTVRLKKPRDPSTLKTNIIRIRLTDHELEKLKAFSEEHGWTISHTICEYIRRLPNPKESD